VENLLLQLLPKNPPSLATRYGVTTGIVLLAALLRYSLGDTLKGYPFLLFFPAIFLASLLFNRASGFVAVVLSTVISLLLWIEPRGTLMIAHRGDLLALILYVAIGCGIAGLTEALRRALERAAQSEREKDLLLREIHHRIRNDLQTITSLLQLGLMQKGDPQEALRSAIDRIGIMSRVYSRLTHDGGATAVPARGFIEGLVEDLRLSAVALRPIALHADVEEAELGIGPAVAIGLVINELVTNALKYAFPHGNPGQVDVTFRREDEDYVLTVRDNGIGCTPGSPSKGTGLGRQLVQQLAMQLKGGIDVSSADGTLATLRFPVESAKGV